MIGHFDRDYKKKSIVKWGIFQKSHCDQLVGIIEAMEFNQKVNMVYNVTERGHCNGYGPIPTTPKRTRSTKKEK